MNSFDELESRSILSIRETYAQYRDIAMLGSIGKDYIIIL